MLRGWLVLAAGLAAGPALAQTPPPRFKWQPGQTVTYSAQQITTVTETTLDDGTNKPVTAATATKLTVTRRWTVKAVDPAGVATLELSIPAMRQQINRPGPRDKDGKPTVDAIVLDSATADGREQMAAYLDKPILTAKVDPQGRVAEAAGAGGSADRLRAELPFRLVLPDRLPAAGGTWDRPFVVKLDPPHGTGEKYDAVQTYTLKGDAQGYAVVGVATALKAPPKDPGELPALVPLLWEGDVYFHKETGRYAGARLGVKREVPNHQGEGTRFVYETQLTEGLADK